MEKKLVDWMSLNTAYNVPLSKDIILAKATTIYDDLKKDNVCHLQPSDPVRECTSSESPRAVYSLPLGSGSKKEFKASNGWLRGFVQREQLRNIKLNGEAESADFEAAEKYPTELAEIIRDGGYSLGQIFNVDEIGLLYKKMPTRTYLSKDEKSMPGQKAAKDRVTILFGGNADGSCKLKPMLIHKSENPRVFKREKVKAKNLPVFYKSQKKAWMTANLFTEWFRDEFKREVEEYCMERNLPFKILLILDNAPGHPQSICDMFEEIKVVFLTPNTTSLLQPMDQGPIATFKSYYLRNTFRNAIRYLDSVSDEDKAKSIKAFWKLFTILNVIRLVDVSWSEVGDNAMAGAWRKVIPRNAAIATNKANLNNEILSMGSKLNLDLSDTPVDDFLSAHDAVLSDEDLLELSQENSMEELIDDDDSGDLSNADAIRSCLENFKTNQYLRADLFQSPFELHCEWNKSALKPSNVINIKVVDKKCEKSNALALAIEKAVNQY
ncbi:tigger transposable element-derived protein 1 [Sergentomyia squamirostris]